MKKMTPKTVENIFVVLVLVCVVFILVRLYAVGIAIAIGALVFHWAFCRCPHCRTYLGRASGAKYCPHCGGRQNE